MVSYPSSNRKVTNMLVHSTEVFIVGSKSQPAPGHGSVLSSQRLVLTLPIPSSAICDRPGFPFLTLGNPRLFLAWIHTFFLNQPTGQPLMPFLKSTPPHHPQDRYDAQTHPIPLTTGSQDPAGYSLSELVTFLPAMAKYLIKMA